MFQNAYQIASQFTWPVVLSRKTVGGQCSSTIGSFVVVNPEGWIITAEHITSQFLEMCVESNQVQTAKNELEAIKNDPSIDRKERRSRMAKVKKPKPLMTENCSGWWGRDGVQLTNITGLKAVDIAVGKLEPFDPAWVTNYPVFKDPTKDMLPGKSLCKLGFPFHNIQPSWDDVTGGFALPPEAVPLPMFPIEGILTRLVEVVVEGGQAPPYPFRFIETSTPGLKGQSGGPTFDEQGTVWAIQSRTANYPLGFDPAVPGTNNRVKVHQFLNVGLGAHPDTIMGLLRQLGVDFNVSAY